LEKEAHQAALNHEPYITTMRSKPFWRDIEKDFTELQVFIDHLSENRSSCKHPAEEWLLDHAVFIAEQVNGLREERDDAAHRPLPFVQQGKQRIYAICAEYMDHVDGRVDLASFLVYLSSYQEISVLSIAEVWSIPLMLRMAILHHLFVASGHVRERHQKCTRIESVIDRIRPHDMTPEKLKEALHEEDFAMPMSGSTIVHLIQHLREYADDTAMVGEWLICNMENGPERLDSIVSYEHQLQAAYQVTVGNLITSLRQLSRWQWSESFEQVSKVEQTLRGEPTGDYEKLD